MDPAYLYRWQINFALVPIKKKLVRGGERDTIEINYSNCAALVCCFSFCKLSLFCLQTVAVVSFNKQNHESWP